MTIDAGRLRHNIRLERLITLLDSNGEEAQDPETGVIPKVWEFMGNTWAAIEPLSTREFIASQQAMSRVNTKIIIRYREGIDFTWRAIHKDKIYNIEGILADKDSGLEYLTLPVSSGTNEGQ